jgi:hypothetical protein
LGKKTGAGGRRLERKGDGAGVKRLEIGKDDLEQKRGDQIRRDENGVL